MRYSYVPESDAAHDAYDPWAIGRAVMAPPSVTSRHPWPADVVPPSSVRALGLLAQDNGWTVELCYSRRFDEQIISVRCDHEMPSDVRLRAVALYRKATARGAWAWSGFRVMASGSWPRPVFLLAEFSAVLMEGWRGTVPALMSALDDFAEINANGAALAKRRTAARKIIRAEHARGVPAFAISLMLGVQGCYDVEGVLKVIASTPVKVSEGR